MNTQNYNNILNKINQTLQQLLDKYPQEVVVIAIAFILLLLLILILTIWLVKKTKTTPKSTQKAAASKPEQLNVKEEIKQPVAADTLKVISEVEEVKNTDRATWLVKFKDSLNRTRTVFENNMANIFSSNKKLDDELLEQLHEGLFRADIGISTTNKLITNLKTTLKEHGEVDWETVKKALKSEAVKLINTVESNQAEQVEPENKVILIVGVNGVGKTTSIGKLTSHFLASDKKVILAAGDTYRAAAIEQLQIWANRLEVDIVKHKAGSDPAAVAYDGVKAAVARKADVLIIDTAGRLHNKNELMQELGKINKVLSKDVPSAPHETWLVIDATTGQNAFQQVKAFKEVVKLTGIIVTKLDGTAKGGAIIGIVDQFQLPIKWIGIGEKASDLQEFNAAEYVDSLF